LSSEEYSRLVLDLMLGFQALGAIALVVLLVRRSARFGLSAAVGVLAALLFASQFPQMPRPAYFALLFGGGPLVGVVGALLVLAALRAYQGKKYQEFLTSMRRYLAPSQWELSPGVQTPALNRSDALVQRWFIAVAAGTGSVILCLLPSPQLDEALQATFSPPGLLIVVVLTFASVTLIEPMHALVLRHESHSQSPVPADAVSRSMPSELSWRSLFRLAGVAMALLVIELTYHLVSKTLHAAGESTNLHATFMILVAGTTPGIVSYYWTAAFQIGAPSPTLRRLAANASVVCTAVLNYPYGVAAAVALGLAGVNGALGGNPSSGAAALLVASPLVGALIALLLGFVTSGVPAYLGAWVLERLSGKVAAVALVAVLIVGVSLPSVAVLAILELSTEQNDWSGLGYAVLGALGWGLGLALSRFDRVVSDAGLQAAAISTAPARALAPAPESTPPPRTSA
jgi:hypothetical protein